MREKGVHNFTPHEREAIKTIVKEGLLMHLSVEDTKMRVENKAHVSVSDRTIWDVRAILKKERKDDLLLLMKDNDEFRDRYMRDFDEVNNLIKLQYDNLERTTDPAMRKVIMDSIHNYVVTRHKLYDFLPSICSGNPFKDAERVAGLENGNFIQQ